MKIDPSNLFSLGATLRREAARIASEVDAGDSKKEIAAEAKREVQPNRPEVRPKPIEIDNMQVRLKFRVDEETGVQVVQVVDTDSGKVVRQIPPEELLNITKALRDMKGFMVSRES